MGQEYIQKLQSQVHSMDPEPQTKERTETLVLNTSFGSMCFSQVSFTRLCPKPLTVIFHWKCLKLKTEGGSSAVVRDRVKTMAQFSYPRPSKGRGRAKIVGCP